MQAMNIAADRVQAQRAFGSRVALAAASLAVAAVSAAAVAPPPNVERLESLCWRVEGVALLDAATRQPLFLYRPHAIREPASTVKLMLLLLAAEEFESGRKSPDDVVAASRRAQTTGGQQIYLAAGERQSLESLTIATAVHSANDAAVALAEGLFGSYERAVAMMNARARELGLTETRFTSPNGLPPAWGDHADASTAYDLALLGCEAVTHPDVQRWCSTRRASIPNHNVTMVNANKLLGRVDGVDGLKTGFTRRAQYCLVATAERAGRRLVCAVLGVPSSRERFELARQLLEYGFARCERTVVLEAGTSLGRRVTRNGVVDPDPSRVDYVRIAAARPLELWLDADNVGLSPTWQVAVPDTIAAPVNAGDAVGEVLVFLWGRVVARVPAVALDTVSDPHKRLGWFDWLRPRRPG
jgi:D-alanyl-D-alanine carboxypeptidase (penicillin-binding protein 5/6)